MATISNWLTDLVDDVTQIAFAEFASACQEHLQASKKWTCSKNSPPMQTNNEHRPNPTCGAYIIIQNSEL